MSLIFYGLVSLGNFEPQYHGTVIEKKQQKDCPSEEKLKKTNSTFISLIFCHSLIKLAYLSFVLFHFIFQNSLLRIFFAQSCRPLSTISGDAVSGSLIHVSRREKLDLQQVYQIYWITSLNSLMCKLQLFKSLKIDNLMQSQDQQKDDLKERINIQSSMDGLIKSKTMMDILSYMLKSEKMRTLTTCSFLNNIGESPESIDSPLQLKLINFLGLKNYMIDNFIFRRKLSKYHIRKKDQLPQLFIEEEQYQAPTGYTHSIHIIQTAGNSIPICQFVPKHRTNNFVLIYAHGNGSDLSDSIAFIDRLSQFIHVQFVMFDYTGYGESQVGDVGEEVICRDLQIVLAWLSQTVKLSDIIMWGFSLGTYPVVVTAAKYPVAAIILQCPIASISCLFHKQLQPDMKFKQDHFANLDYITNISQNTKILIMHSSDDEIIPFSHAKLLYTKYLMKNGGSNIDFIEIAKIRHNSLHKYIVSPVENQLQKEVFSFMTDVIYCNHKINDSIGTLNTENSITLKQQPNIAQKQPSQPVVSLNNSKKFQKKKKNLQLSQQLKSLRMKITQAEIEDMPADMHQLVVEQQLAKDRKTKIQKVRQRILDSKGKNCFCFPNKL